MKIPGQQRKAISPIVATVLIIAATLIAAAAIIGYVFGIFGSSSNTPNIGVTSAALSHLVTGTPTSAGLVVACTSSSNYWGTLVVSNTGSASGGLTGVTITYGGATVTAALSSCTVGASGSGASTQTLYFTGLPASPAPGTLAGVTFNGFVTTSAGAQASFTGTFV